MGKYEITFKTWDKIAQLYAEKFMDLDIYNASYDAFCELLNRDSASVLEIGCGPGNVTKYLLQKRPNLKILATDIAPSMLEIAKKNNPSAECRLLDAREIDTISQTFDAIIGGFCMPYLSKEDCAKLFSDAHALLNQSGIAYFSAIEGESEQSGFQTGSGGDQAYVYYHSEKDIFSACNNVGFNLIQVIRIPYQKSNGEIETHIIFILTK